MIWSTYLIAVVVILAIALAWVTVQHWSRRFSARHPEYGPAVESMGCGKACVCEETDPCPQRKSRTIEPSSSVKKEPT